MPRKKATEEEAPVEETLEPKTRTRALKTPEESLKSNLHPEKLTYAKFSEMRRSLDDDKMTVGRLLLYVVLVIAIGIALTIGVQSYIRYQNEQQNNPTNNNTNTVSQPQTQSVVKTNTEFQSDNRAQPPILAADKFSDKAQTAGTDISVAGPFAAWNGLRYDRYNTTERLTLEFSADVKDPKAAVSYNANEKVIYIDIDKVTNGKPELKPGTELIKLSTDTTAVKTVQNSSNGNKLRLSVYVSEAVKFTAQYSGNKLIVDVRQADLVTTTTPPPTTETPVVSAPIANDPGKPTAPFYDNKYSKNPQYISSSYTGNKLRVWNYTYRDYGDRYEFKFRIKDDGSKVNPMKPNVKAYLNNNAADPKLIVEINNINWEILSNYTKAECFDNVSFGNVERICGKFDAAKSMVTYTIDLYKLSDFEVDSIENSTVDSSRPGEVIWVKIKDN